MGITCRNTLITITSIVHCISTILSPDIRHIDQTNEFDTSLMSLEEFLCTDHQSSWNRHRHNLHGKPYPMMSPKVFSRIASNNPKHQHNHKGMIVCKTQIKSILRVYDHICIYIYIWTIVRLYNYRFNIFKTPYIYGDPKLFLENTCWSLLPPVPIDSQQLIEGTDLISILPGWWHWRALMRDPPSWKTTKSMETHVSGW